MKKNKYYTFIISGNGSPFLKKIHVRAKTVKILGGICFLLLAGSLFLISDYFQIASNQFQLQKAIREKEELKKQFYTVENKLNDLTRELLQLKDFNRKIRAITSVNHKSPLQKQYGKILLSPDLVALSTPSALNRKPSSLAALKPDVPSKTTHSFLKTEPASYTELVIQIENLNEKTKLVKQNAWDIFSNLLTRKEILSNTPSILPVKGWISSSFGYRNETFYADHDLRFHRGLDIAANIGSPVFASASGQVIRAGYDDKGYGWYVVIDHGYNVKTFYAHMSKIETQTEKYVKRGQVIGEVGNTGKSTGPHLHYEIHLFGVPVNPINYIMDEDLLIQYASQKDSFSFY